MKDCIFCNLDKKEICNTTIEETRNFYVKTAVGSLVEGYLLIISKRHINSMIKLEDTEKREFLDLVIKYRRKFKQLYGRYPIVFEHGTPDENSKVSASSIVHMHAHIVNHNFKDEEKIINNLNLKPVDNDFIYQRKDKNYIFYINPEGINYMSYDFKPVSQLMRLCIAKDLNMEDKYDWKKYTFEDNIIKTIKSFTKN